ncbi:ATP-binding protein [Streptomyces sp. MK5]|uniref:ATP-binding protein n=1 Tax=Streptomyces sp. MK5 TaxID=3064253 RepID=UPI00274210CF|nr:ATP-binding protein [Streptomyces sp. MK5]
MPAHLDDAVQRLAEEDADAPCQPRKQVNWSPTPCATALGPIVLRLIRHQVLTCEVFDADVGSPRVRRARAVDENGRGLFLVARLSHRWGAPWVSGGKVVWAEEDPTDTPSPAGTSSPAGAACAAH